MKIKIAAVNPREKISKGYRLRPSTHNMIRKIQNELESTQDKVISAAIKLYYIELKNNNK